MKKIITLSGDIGSGKSSVAESLCSSLGFEIVGTGKIQREIAASKGMTTLELNKASQTDRSIDDEIDAFVIDLGQNRDNLIVDSRLAWHFIPESFKVFLTVDTVVGAERVFGDSRSEENNTTLEETLKNNMSRQYLEDIRFQKLYNIQFRKFSNYDLVVDTSFCSPEEVANKIMESFQSFLASTSYLKVWLDPKRLFPTQNVRDISMTEYDEFSKLLLENGYPRDFSVEVIVVNGFIYIWGDHIPVMAAEKNRVGLIPVDIRSEHEEEEIIPGLTAKKVAYDVNKSTIYDWEDALEFKYKLYPDKIDTKH